MHRDETGIGVDKLEMQQSGFMATLIVYNNPLNVRAHPHGLPIEIRHRSLELVQRGVTSSTIKIEPGRYFVIAKVPDGRDIHITVAVPAGQHVVAQLPAAERDGSGITLFSLRVPTALVVLKQNTQGIARKYGLRVRGFAGNMLTGPLRSSSMKWVPSRGDDNSVVLEINQPDLAIVQIIPPARPPVNLVVSLGSGRGPSVQFTFQLGPDGILRLNLRWDRAVIDPLIYHQREPYEAALAFAVDRLPNTPLSEDKDAARTISCAYTLLRVRHHKALEAWIAELNRKHNTTLPDGVVVRAELLARQGWHQTALETLLELPPCGLPIFTQGITYAVNRLRLYCAKRCYMNFSDRLIERAMRLLAILEPIACSADQGMPLTNFTKMPSKVALNLLKFPCTHRR